MVKATEKAALASRQAERKTNMRLARAAIAERDDVFARDDVLAARQLQDERLVERGDRRKVESVEALYRREPGGADAALNHPSFTVDEYEFDDSQQIADVVLAVARGFKGNLLIFPQDGRKFELAQASGERHPRRRRTSRWKLTRSCRRARNELAIIGRRGCLDAQRR